MPVPFADDVLLVSSPNKGGMALVSGNSVAILDHDDSTGIWIAGDTFYRCVIVGPEDERRMQLQSFSASKGKQILAVDSLYDFHDVLVFQGKVYLVSTGTNEVLVFDETGMEVRRHSFPGGEDTWHINCLSLWDGKVVLSAFGEFDSFRGYKHNSLNRGFLMELESGLKIWEGLSQPHTPAQHQGRYFICNSEAKQLLVKNALGVVTEIDFDGYVRGLAFGQNFIYVGLSQSRNLATPGENNRYGRIVAIDSKSFEKCGEISVPFSEIYDLRLIDRTSLFPALMLGLNYEGLKTDVSQKRQQNILLTAALEQFRRVERHLIAGSIIRLLRWLKRDNSFGNPDIRSDASRPGRTEN